MPGVYTSDAASVAEAAYEKHAAAGRQQQGGISEAAAAGASGRSRACPRGFATRRGASMVENAIASAVGEALATRKEQMREGDGGPEHVCLAAISWRTLGLTRPKRVPRWRPGLCWRRLTTSLHTRGGGACASSATGGAVRLLDRRERSHAPRNVYYDGSMVKGGEGQGSPQMCCDAGARQAIVLTELGRDAQRCVLVDARSSA